MAKLTELFGNWGLTKGLSPQSSFGHLWNSIYGVAIRSCIHQTIWSDTQKLVPFLLTERPQSNSIKIWALVKSMFSAILSFLDLGFGHLHSLAGTRPLFRESYVHCDHGILSPPILVDTTHGNIVPKIHFS